MESEFLFFFLLKFRLLFFLIQWAKSHLPANYKDSRNPPYPYWLYYLWANIRSLNEFRAMRNLTTFDFRPHCGVGKVSQNLAAGYLLAGSLLKNFAKIFSAPFLSILIHILSDGIVHGLDLDTSPAMQFLFYLHQVFPSFDPLVLIFLLESFDEHSYSIFRSLSPCLPSRRMPSSVSSVAVRSSVISAVDSTCH